MPCSNIQYATKTAYSGNTSPNPAQLVLLKKTVTGDPVGFRDTPIHRPFGTHLAGPYRNLFMVMAVKNRRLKKYVWKQGLKSE